jgi:hypothetical protein
VPDGCRNVRSMVSRRRREAREAGRRIGSAVSAYMDDVEREEWHRLQSAMPPRDDAQSASFIADVVAELLPRAGDSIDSVIAALEVWKDVREKAADDQRGEHIASIYTTIALTGVGNLFGFIPNTSPAYRAHLADEGKRRGWRR